MDNDTFDSFLDEIEPLPLSSDVVSEKKAERAEHIYNKHKKNVFGESDTFEFFWKIRYKVFDLEKPGNITEVEDIYTRATKRDKEHGVRILKEESQFMVNGTYKLALKWGEYKRVERKQVQGCV